MEVLIRSANVELYITNHRKTVTAAIIPRGCIATVLAVPANRLVYIVPKYTSLFAVEHNRTDQNRLSQRGDGTVLDDEHWISQPRSSGNICATS